ncbi:carbamate kinase [Soehngenia longivitae]|uniref:Carbamate kinase n=1 Tax=Soehngenia longivitae TaxID=2562294 RepID=A0A4Z0D941_9FIRM|nr:carbamate kinase [Soehngenia longivitae]TFZ41352.1 carbamate kinase [Soehngenia longivitae]
MRPTRVVVALGGNALEDKSMPSTAEAQLEVVKRTSEYIADISLAGYEIAVVHGNGPQVGRILLATEAAKDVTPPMPFDVCGAMSQGYIGYHIQQALKFALKKRGKNIPVATVITQVVVDKDDEAFNNPTKPIGPFYTEEEAKKLAEEKGYVVKEDAGRGYRRVVPSPLPKKIVEIDTIKTLWDTTIAVTCGGGGIPVIEKEDGSLEGVAAVIDKDLAAQRLAEDMDADILLILTEVEKVAINFNKPDQKSLDHMSVEEALKYMEEGHFAPGSMLPKVKAAVNFAKSKPGRKAIITSLYKAKEALDGISGTVIEM